jgi:hypothetical protein
MRDQSKNESDNLPQAARESKHGDFAAAQLRSEMAEAPAQRYLFLK